jgi:hypothetical protein
MKKILFVFLSMFFVSLVYAQNGIITGHITDSTFKNPFTLATVTVFRAADTTIVTYRLSNESGDFKIPGLPLGVPLRFIISYSGHSTYRKEFMLTASNAQLRFDSLVLKPLQGELEEVTVTAERPPVVIRKDTIEFNASSFKTLPNALVEDLLKKFPGVQVDADGNITVNGKPVNRILVDGKAFFGDDPKMATKNLPANIIDKVQVVDDKEQEMISGTLNPNDIGKVLNLTLKKGVKKGWFGKLYGGGGTGKLYETGGIANIFRDTLQLSVLGYANNMNKAGFGMQELLQSGGLSRSQSNSGGTSIYISSNGVGSNVSIGGISFGGMPNNGGIATSRGTGFNLNHTPNAKRSFFVQYFFGNTVVDRQVETGITQYFNDTVINNLSRQHGKTVGNAHNASVGLRLKPDSVTNLLINVGYTLGLSDENRYSDISTTNNKLGDLSMGTIFQNNRSSSHYYRHNISLVKLSRKKKGRQLSITHSLDINNRYSNFLTESETNFFYPLTATQVLNQLRRDSLPRTDARMYATYSEPLTKQLTLRFVSQVEYGKNKNDISTYAQSASRKYDSLYLNLSSYLKRETGRITNTAYLMFKYRNLTISPGLRSLWQSSEVEAPSLAGRFRQNRHNFLPTLNIVYKQLNIFYDQGIVLPGYQYLIAVTDNSNPYFIIKSNPSLLPSTRYNLGVNYYYNNVKKNFSAFLNGQILFTRNDIVDNITVDDRGVQTTTPVNASGSRRYYTNYSFNKQYKYSQRFSLATNIGGSQSYTRNRLLFNNVSSWQNTYSINNWGGINLNWHDLFEWNNTFTTINNFTRYSSSQFPNLNLFGYNLSTEMIVRYPKHVIWETQLNWNRYATSAPGFPKKVVRWNAGVNFTILKEERGVLNLRVYDILNQNNFVQTNATRNMVNITSTNVLPRYFMATFTYNVRAMGAAKRKVGGSLFNF